MKNILLLNVVLFSINAKVAIVSSSENIDQSPVILSGVKISNSVMEKIPPAQMEDAVRKIYEESADYQHGFGESLKKWFPRKKVEIGEDNVWICGLDGPFICECGNFLGIDSLWIWFERLRHWCYGIEFWKAHDDKHCPCADYAIAQRVANVKDVELKILKVEKDGSLVPISVTEISLNQPKKEEKQSEIIVDSVKNDQSVIEQTPPEPAVEKCEYNANLCSVRAVDLLFKWLIRNENINALQVELDGPHDHAILKQKIISLIAQIQNEIDEIARLIEAVDQKEVVNYFKSLQFEFEKKLMLKNNIMILTMRRFALKTSFLEIIEVAEKKLKELYDYDSKIAYYRYKFLHREAIEMAKVINDDSKDLFTQEEVKVLLNNMNELRFICTFHEDIDVSNLLKDYSFLYTSHLVKYLVETKNVEKKYYIYHYNDVKKMIKYMEFYYREREIISKTADYKYHLDIVLNLVIAVMQKCNALLNDNVENLDLVFTGDKNIDVIESAEILLKYTRLMNEFCSIVTFYKQQFDLDFADPKSAFKNQKMLECVAVFEKEVMEKTTSLQNVCYAHIGDCYAIRLIVDYESLENEINNIFFAIDCYCKSDKQVIDNFSNVLELLLNSLKDQKFSAELKQVISIGLANRKLNCENYFNKCKEVITADQANRFKAIMAGM